MCANSDDAVQLKKENRNAVASASVKEAMKRLKEGSTVIGRIESSFVLLRQGEKEGGFKLITPERKTETGYVLIRARSGSERTAKRFGSARYSRDVGVGVWAERSVHQVGNIGATKHPDIRRDCKRGLQKDSRPYLKMAGR